MGVSIHKETMNALEEYFSGSWAIVNIHNIKVQQLCKVYYTQHLDTVAYNECQYCMSVIFPLYTTHVTGGYFNYTQHVA